MASVALLGVDGVVLWEGVLEAPQAASGACLELLRRGLNHLGRTLSDASGFAADLGPGSFTGVRVGVTLAKTFAFLGSVKALGAPAFDLIDPAGPVVLPSKRGEWFVREPGKEPYRVTDLDGIAAVGFGPGIEHPVYPSAARFGAILNRLVPVAAEELTPAYLVPPSISVPKTPYGGQIAR